MLNFWIGILSLPNKNRKSPNALKTVDFRLSAPNGDRFFHRLLVVLTFTFLIPLKAQDITGDWHGMLQELGLRVVFHITGNGTGHTATMDSPDQGGFGIPVTKVDFQRDSLHLGLPQLGITYAARLEEGTFKGIFEQGFAKLPLDLTPRPITAIKPDRPQEPSPPFPYTIEEVAFTNPAAGITLSGTLTLPNTPGKHPAVVLISGSGPQDRNEEIAGHKPFLVLADTLTRNGIAVLRFDDRGTGRSSGEFASATTYDFADDVVNAVAYLLTRTEINQRKIGLIGHSEGGLVASMVAAEDNEIDFIVLMAAPGIPGDQLLSDQGRSIEQVAGLPEGQDRPGAIRDTMIDMALRINDLDVLRDSLTVFLEMEDNKEPIVPKGMDKDQFIRAQVNAMANPWMSAFLRYQPSAALENVQCPVLVMNGEQDLQVAAEENLAAISEALSNGGNRDVTLMELPHLNHLFQECTTGLPMEYGTISQTISPTALGPLVKWVLSKSR